MEGTRILFIEGLPGSGKTSLAYGLGEMIPGSRVYLENRGENPLHVVEPGEDAAAFEGVASMSPAEFVEASLQRYKSFVSSDPAGLSIFESYPYQSGARVLLQINAPQEVIVDYIRQLEIVCQPLNPRMVFLQFENAAADYEAISDVRGDHWSNAIDAFIQASPWAQSRSLGGREATAAFLESYAELLRLLTAASTLPRLELPGGESFGPHTKAAVLEWLGGA